MFEYALPTSKSVVAAALLALIPAMNAPAAYAQSMDVRETSSTVVRYDDLNMSSPQGQSALKSRIARAVTKVCGSVTTSNLEERRDVIQCRTKALRNAYAAAKINDQVLASR